MPYRICKSLVVENAHMLTKHPDQCKFPHGHSRKIEFVLESDNLDGNDMVCDFKIIKSALGEFVDRFDHAMCVNTDDKQFETLNEVYGDHIIPFDGADPTTESMARMIFNVCRAKLQEYADSNEGDYPLAPGVRLIKVRVWETASSWAEYSE